MAKRKKISKKEAAKHVSGHQPAAAVQNDTFPIASLQDLQAHKVAIVCDWLTGTGGAERVVLELHKMFPAAPIYTSQYNKDPKIWYGDRWFQDADVRTGWLQRLPKKLKKFLPLLRMRYFSRLDLSTYDLVLISSGAEAKAIKAGPDTTVVWYCHAPTHYYWSRYKQYMKHPGLGAFNFVARIALFLLVRPLRRWDYRAAQKPQHIIANSTHTQSEIQKYYNRSSTVVFPPVDTERFQAAGGASGSTRTSSAADTSDHFGFVTAGRQVPYKRIDLAVEACSRLKLPLTVIGNGPDHTKLTAMAGPTVRFLNGVSDAEMARHFQLAEAFIFPGIDDFGIVAVEAMSAGTPVIAYQAGGALDYVQEGVTGSFFSNDSTDSLIATLRKFQSSAYDRAAIRKQAKAYSHQAFADSMTKAVRTFLQDK